MRTFLILYFQIDRWYAQNIKHKNIMRRVETKCCDAQLVNILISLEFLIKLAMMKGFIKDVESESRGKSFSRPRNFLCVRLLSQLLSAFRLYILSQAERHKSHLRIRLPQFY